MRKWFEVSARWFRCSKRGGVREKLSSLIKTCQRAGYLTPVTDSELKLTVFLEQEDPEFPQLRVNKLRVVPGVEPCCWVCGPFIMTGMRRTRLCANHLSWCGAFKAQPLNWNFGHLVATCQQCGKNRRKKRKNIFNTRRKSLENFKTKIIILVF